MLSCQCCPRHNIYIYIAGARILVARYMIQVAYVATGKVSIFFVPFRCDRISPHRPSLQPLNRYFLTILGSLLGVCSVSSFLFFRLNDASSGQTAGRFNTLSWNSRSSTTTAVLHTPPSNTKTDSGLPRPNGKAIRRGR